MSDGHMDNRLRSRRRELGHSQAEAAATMGVDQGTVSGWERGTQLPTTPEKQETLAAYLEVPVAEVVRWVASEQSRRMLSSISPDSGVADLLRQLIADIAELRPVRNEVAELRESVDRLRVDVFAAAETGELGLPLRATPPRRAAPPATPPRRAAPRRSKT